MIKSDMVTCLPHVRRIDYADLSLHLFLCNRSVSAKKGLNLVCLLGEDLEKFASFV